MMSNSWGLIARLKKPTKPSPVKAAIFKPRMIIIPSPPFCPDIP